MTIRVVGDANLGQEDCFYHSAFAQNSFAIWQPPSEIIARGKDVSSKAAPAHFLRLSF
jgi:hypothetical protein